MLSPENALDCPSAIATYGKRSPVLKFPRSRQFLVQKFVTSTQWVLFLFRVFLDSGQPVTYTTGVEVVGLKCHLLQARSGRDR